MSRRFIVIDWTRAGDAKAGQAERVAIAIGQYGLREVFRGARTIILADSDLPRIAFMPGGGIVLGDLFCSRDGGRSVDALGQREYEAFKASRGEFFLRDYWGGYVAVIVDEQARTTTVLRDPSGFLCCYRSSFEGLDLLYSDLDLISHVGLVDARPDWPAVAHFLTYASLRPAKTCISGVEEVVASCRAEISASEFRTTAAWTPWMFATRITLLEDQREAAERLQTAVDDAVRSWASRSSRVLLELSGGLDSSVVAASLHRAGSDVQAVTLVTPDRGADERRYAAAVADHIGAPLEIVHLSDQSADLTAPPKTLLPRPGIRTLQQLVDREFERVAQNLGVDAFFGGGGGDSVFCYMYTAAPATDALLHAGPGRLFFQTVADLAALHQCTVWTAFQLAVRKTFRARRPWRSSGDFLNPAVLMDGPDAHPWLTIPPRALPGQIEHVQTIMTVQNALDGAQRSSVGPIRFPLMSQPIVELCLRIPSWMWINDGRNRSIVRDAFADRLPPTVLARRTKGDFGGLSGSIYKLNKSRLSDFLLDGCLAGAGILNRTELEAYLRAPTAARDVRFYRIIQLANVEAWARAWIARRESTATPPILSAREQSSAA